VRMLTEEEKKNGRPTRSKKRREREKLLYPFAEGGGGLEFAADQKGREGKGREKKKRGKASRSQVSVTSAKSTGKRRGVKESTPFTKRKKKKKRKKAHA